KKIRNAIPHFLGGFVGEGNRQNMFSGNATGDEMGHAVGNGARLAGAGACENQHRAFGGFRGATLFWIQFRKKSEHGFVEVKNICNSMLADARETRKWGSIFR